MIQYNEDDLFCRGAVTKGSLYYDEHFHFVFGSGLAKAYEMESEFANYPRIILDDALKPPSYSVGIERDNTNTLYLDYLKMGYELFKTVSQEDGFKLYITKQQTKIKKALQKYKNSPKVMTKYYWLRNYSDDFCVHNGFENLIIE